MFLYTCICILEIKKHKFASKGKFFLSVSDIVPLIQCNIVFGFSCNLKVRYENQAYLLLGRLSYPICMTMC